MIDTRPLTTRLLSLASQENNDSEEYDLMMEAYHRITSLEQQLAAAQKEVNRIYERLCDAQDTEHEHKEKPSEAVK